MTTYTITQKISGMVIGEYQGETEAEALDAMARDAGYGSFKESCEVTGEDPENHTLLIENHDRLVVNGDITSLEAAAELMDDEIREELHDDIAPCSPQDFLNAYIKAHKAKFGEDFIVN